MKLFLAALLILAAVTACTTLSSVTIRCPAGTDMYLTVVNEDQVEQIKESIFKLLDKPGSDNKEMVWLGQLMRPGTKVYFATCDKK